MSALAPTLEAFFSQRLINEKGVSQHTIAAYRGTFRLLLSFAQRRTGKQPCKLEIEDLDAIVTYLTKEEADALIDAPDCSRWIGRRDHALLTVAIQTGARVSELTALRCQDVHLGTGPHAQITGKRRKQRATPLTKHTVAVLREWIRERNGQPDEPLFPTSRGRALSRDAIALLVAKHANTASRNCLTLHNKTVSPHTLRHTAAMNLLHAAVDSTVIALWLGHESVEATQIYLHADMRIKERALARTTPQDAKPGRYRPPDTLLAFLEAL